MNRCLLIGLLTLSVAGPAFAVDHNNLDAGRPLSFDDAEPLALREQDFDFGTRFAAPRRHPLGGGLDFEYLYGFAPNSHLSVGLTPSAGGRSDSRDTGLSAGDLSLGVFHQFHREYGNTPGLAVRADLGLPTGRSSQGELLRLRGILSRSVNQFDHFHVNVDLNVDTDPRPGDRQVNPGLIFGYSHPLGYPRSFTRTGLAELGIQAGPREGAGPVVTLGVGMRQQVSVRSVVYVGVESDVAAFNGAPGDRVRLVLGYSTAF